MLIRFVLCFGLLFSLPVFAQDTIRISYNSDWPPYSYGVADQVKGVLPDLMDELFGKHLGMKVEHGGFPWLRAQEVVKSGRYDAMVTFPSNTRLDYALRSENIVYNLRQKPVVKRGSVAEKALIANPDISELANHQVCAMIGDGWSKNFYTQHNIPFRTAKDTQACLRLVAAGRMDVFLHMDAATQHNMRLSGTASKLSHLPHVMGNLPFTLLVSKKMPNGADVIIRFDKLLSKLMEDQTYNQLITTLDNKAYTVE